MKDGEFTNGDVWINGKKIGKVTSLSISFPSVATMLDLKYPNWSRSLADQFGEHPPRIFHEGP